ncbi:MAG TPA: response regulator [Tepidisphaeraceae bacterium]
MLIVEDERVARRALTALLAGHGYDAKSFDSAEALLEEVEQKGTEPKVILADVDLPGMSGLQMLDKLVQNRPDLQAYLITAAEGEEIEQFCESHSCQYLRKPLNLGKLLSLLSDNQAA